MSGIHWTSHTEYYDAEGNEVYVTDTLPLDDFDLPDVDPAEDALDDEELPDDD